MAKKRRCKIPHDVFLPGILETGVPKPSEIFLPLRLVDSDGRSLFPIEVDRERGHAYICEVTETRGVDFRYVVLAELDAVVDRGWKGVTLRDLLRS